ncbi:MAG TPA: SsrA-binding protein SmpB [Chloroflexota bacterium]
MNGRERQKVYATNRKAAYDYHILETWEAGVALTGTEVKSVRNGRVNLREAFAKLIAGEVWLLNAHISPYAQGNRFNHDPTRARKLLLHKGEIARLIGKLKEGGVTLVPLSIYDRRGHIKVQLALARGKRKYDKREDIARREAQREIARAVRQRV